MQHVELQLHLSSKLPLQLLLKLLLAVRQRAKTERETNLDSEGISDLRLMS